MAKSTIFVDPARPQNLQTTIFIAPARPENLQKMHPGNLQNTIFVDPAPPANLQSDIFTTLALLLGGFGGIVRLARATSTLPGDSFRQHALMWYVCEALRGHHMCRHEIFF